MCKAAFMSLVTKDLTKKLASFSSKSLEINPWHLADLLKKTLENKKIRAENEKLRAKLAPTKQVKDELKDSLKKKGKGLYCVEPFMNGGKTYNPGMAVTPANIGGNAKEPSAQLIKRLIAADVLFEVK